MDKKIFLIENHRLTRDGIRMILEKETSFKIVGESKKGNDAVQLAHRLVPDVVLIDISEPDLGEIETIRQILSELPDVRVLVISINSSRRHVTETLGAGVMGYLHKDAAAEDLIDAVRTVASGNAYLCPSIAGVIASDYQRRYFEGREGKGEEALSLRERQVLQLIAEGHSTKEVAYSLKVSTKTVEGHRAQIMKKLNLDNMAGLIKYAIREGITTLE